MRRGISLNESKVIMEERLKTLLLKNIELKLESNMNSLHPLLHKKMEF